MWCEQSGNPRCVNGNWRYAHMFHSIQIESEKHAPMIYGESMEGGERVPMIHTA